MDTSKVYLDTCLLIGCFKWLLEKNYQHQFIEKILLLVKREKEQPFIITFLKEHKNIEKFISLVSVAEIISVLKYNKDFRHYKLTLGEINNLLVVLMTMIGFEIIVEIEIDGKKIKGNLITRAINNYIDKHEHVLDCIHVDIAKTNDLLFITNEDKFGLLKDLDCHIMTFNKLVKQFEKS